jgi:hypothetical protein
MPKTCKRPDCDEERYSRIGMEFHLLKDHELGRDRLRRSGR